MLQNAGYFCKEMSKNGRARGVNTKIATKVESGRIGKKIYVENEYYIFKKRQKKEKKPFFLQKLEKIFGASSFFAYKKAAFYRALL